MLFINRRKKKNLCSKWKIKDKVENDENINEITIIYKYNNNVRIFGDKFVKENKDKCVIVYDGKEYDLYV